MTASTHELEFHGGILQRGFWLYVWKITLPDGATLHYVGRTGDSSSVNAQSPFARMGQHLGFAKNSNMLRRHLQEHHGSPDGCVFHLVAHGPILEETKDREGHNERRDIIAAMEKALAEDMTAAGYTVMNTVRCRKSLNVDQYTQIRTAFASQFPALGSGSVSLRNPR